MNIGLKKKIISIAAVVAITATIGSGCVLAKSNDITVTFDGEKISFDVQPEIVDGRVMVPMRTIFETFGAKVKWDSDTQTITAKKKSKTIQMTIGSNNMTKNDETYSSDVAPIIEDGRTLVPIRAISDMLGLDVEWNEKNNTVTITTPQDDEDESWKDNTGTVDLDNVEVTGDGISVSDNIITISKGGDFEVTGTLDDGQIVIDTEEKVKLRLSGMSLTNKNGSAVYVKNADKAYITLTDNTENTLTDGENYTSGDENEKGCITSRDNLEIKGSGSLTLNGNYNHGIFSSNSIEIGNGNINVNAKNDGIHANDTLAISGGTVNVTAEGDGLQAEEILDISGGEVNVTTTGEVKASTSNDFGGRGEMKDSLQMTDDEIQSMREQMNNNQFTQTEESDDSDDTSSKGIKADWMLDISGGEVTVNSTDHAIHCTSDINITGGTLCRWHGTVRRYRLLQLLQRGQPGKGHCRLQGGRCRGTRLCGRCHRRGRRQRHGGQDQGRGRPRGHSGQQRRSDEACAHDRDEPHRFPARHRRARRRCVQLLQSRPARHDRQARGQDHQHLLHDERAGPRDRLRLRCRQGCPEDADQEHRL